MPTAPSTPPATKEGFSDKYRLGEVIFREGLFKGVRIGTRNSDKHTVAVKYCNRKNLSRADEEVIRKEADVMKSMKHPNVVTTLDFYEESNLFYIVMEYLKGGQLFDRLIQKSHFNEKEAKNLVVSILKALEYCHGKKIVHRYSADYLVYMFTLQQGFET